MILCVLSVRKQVSLCRYVGLFTSKKNSPPFSPPCIWCFSHQMCRVICRICPNAPSDDHYEKCALCGLFNLAGFFLFSPPCISYQMCSVIRKNHVKYVESSANVSSYDHYVPCGLLFYLAGFFLFLPFWRCLLTSNVPSPWHNHVEYAQWFANVCAVVIIMNCIGTWLLYLAGSFLFCWGGVFLCQTCPVCLWIVYYTIWLL